MLTHSSKDVLTPISESVSQLVVFLSEAEISQSPVPDLTAAAAMVAQQVRQLVDIGARMTKAQTAHEKYETDQQKQRTAVAEAKLNMQRGLDELQAGAKALEGSAESLRGDPYSSNGRMELISSTKQILDGTSLLLNHYDVITIQTIVAGAVASQRLSNRFRDATTVDSLLETVRPLCDSLVVVIRSVKKRSADLIDSHAAARMDESAGNLAKYAPLLVTVGKLVVLELAAGGDTGNSPTQSSRIALCQSIWTQCQEIIDAMSSTFSQRQKAMLESLQGEWNGSVVSSLTAALDGIHSAESSQKRMVAGSTLEGAVNEVAGVLERLSQKVDSDIVVSGGSFQENESTKQLVAAAARFGHSLAVSSEAYNVAAKAHAEANAMLSDSNADSDSIEYLQAEAQRDISLEMLNSAELQLTGLSPQLTHLLMLLSSAILAQSASGLKIDGPLMSVLFDLSKEDHSPERGAELFSKVAGRLSGLSLFVDENPGDSTVGDRLSLSSVAAAVEHLQKLLPTIQAVILAARDAHQSGDQNRIVASQETLVAVKALWGKEVDGIISVLMGSSPSTTGLKDDAPLIKHAIASFKNAILKSELLVSTQTASLQHALQLYRKSSTDDADVKRAAIMQMNESVASLSALLADLDSPSTGSGDLHSLFIQKAKELGIDGILDRLTTASQDEARIVELDEDDVVGLEQLVSLRWPVRGENERAGIAGLLGPTAPSSAGDAASKEAGNGLLDVFDSLSMSGSDDTAGNKMAVSDYLSSKIASAHLKIEENLKEEREAALERENAEKRRLKQEQLRREEEERARSEEAEKEALLQHLLDTAHTVEAMAELAPRLELPSDIKEGQQIVVVAESEPKLLSEQEAELNPIAAVANDLHVTASRWTCNDNAIVACSLKCSQVLEELSHAYRSSDAGSRKAIIDSSRVLNQTAQRLYTLVKPLQDACVDKRLQDALRISNERVTTIAQQLKITASVKAANVSHASSEEAHESVEDDAAQQLVFSAQLLGGSIKRLMHNAEVASMRVSIKPGAEGSDIAVFRRKVYVERISLRPHRLLQGQTPKAPVPAVRSTGKISPPAPTEMREPKSIVPTVQKRGGGLAM